MTRFSRTGWCGFYLLYKQKTEIAFFVSFLDSSLHPYFETVPAPIFRQTLFFLFYRSFRLTLWLNFDKKLHFPLFSPVQFFILENCLEDIILQEYKKHLAKFSVLVYHKRRKRNTTAVVARTAVLY